MEEIKQEEITQKVEQPNENTQTYDFNKLHESIDKLMKENELLKKEIMSLKNTTSQEEKIEVKKEINFDLWKDKF